MDKRLSVRLFGQEIGLLEQDISDRIKFTYNDDNNIPISYRLPVSKKSFTDEDCRPYFHGLLSEADSVRKYLGKIFHINPNDDFALLQAIGRDCAGAISFHNPEEPVKPDESAQLEYTLLSDNELKKNIEELRSKPFFMQADNDIRIALGGCQYKGSVILIDGKVCLPKNSTPTTHILKSADTVNEYVCMKVAKKLDINVAEVEIRNIENIRYLLIERYDREIKNNVIKRIHQETFCQALGGNISLKRYFELFDTTVTPTVSKSMFMKTFIFSFIIGNNDASSRNYSLLYKGEQTVLAPIYDVLCTYACKKFKRNLSMQTIKKLITEKIFEKICNEVDYSYKNFIKDFYYIAENLHKFIEEEKDFFDKEEQKVIDIILDCVDKRADLIDYL